MNSYIKKLSASNLGKTNTNDHYWVVPADASPLKFYGINPKLNLEKKEITHHDGTSGKKYKTRLHWGRKPGLAYPKGEWRIARVRDFFEDNNVQVSEEVIVTRKKTNQGYKFYADIIKKTNRSKIDTVEKKKTILEALNDNSTYVSIKKFLRLNQPKFRKNLLTIYSDKCVVSNCNVLEVLEAAHIFDHSKSQDNSTSNGIILRRDIHALFDKKLLKINPDSFKVELDNSLKNSEYKSYQGKTISKDINGNYPSQEYLRKKYTS